MSVTIDSTVVEKLQEVINTKEKIKQAIEEKGQSLDGVSFTQYADKIKKIESGGAEIERSIKKYIEAGGTFSGQINMTSYDGLLEYNDTENVNFNSFFTDNRQLIRAPLLNTQNATSIYYTFSKCGRLEEVPEYNFDKVGDAQGCFNGCTALKKIPAYDFRNVYTFSRFVNTCTNIEEIWIKNINANLQVGSGSEYGHLLTLDSLINLIRELIISTKITKTLTVGSTNLEKLANVYVKIVDITDEMRAKDDLIDKKLPFEVCESNTEGAMLLTDYVAEKKWQLA